MTFPDAITEALPPDDRMRIGIVTQSAPLAVDVQGASVMAPGVLNFAHFSVGDTVALLRQDQSWLVLGSIAPSSSSGITGLVGFSGSPGVDTTTSATYNNYGVNTATTFTKMIPGTRVRIDFSTSIFASGGSAGAQFGLQFIGANTVYDMTRMLINTAGEHLTFAGGGVFSGLPAGTFSVQPLWLRYSGAGTLTSTAGDDWLTYIVQEVN